MLETVANIQKVCKSYYLGKVEIKALKQVSLQVPSGSFTFIVGKSGSGKSTLLNLLGAIDIPTSGYIEINGVKLSGLNDNSLSDFRGESIGHIFQNFNLIPVLNLYENIEYPLLLQNIPKKERKFTVNEFIEATGLSGLEKHLPSELSGGQMQRVAIARALVKKPSIVLADEPTANLDSVTGGEIISLMLDMKKQYRTAFVFSTHDKEILKEADDIYTLVDGTMEDSYDK
ncbi:MAG: ABC transporter ATP-binding protein [Sulfurovum sp.]|nr:ABC transporter ATP-binding protein [Sulfurovum sp.]